MRRWLFASAGVLVACVGLLALARSELPRLRTAGLPAMSSQQLRAAPFDASAFRRWQYHATLSSGGGTDSVTVIPYEGGSYIELALKRLHGSLRMAGPVDSSGHFSGGPDLKDVGNEYVEYVVASFHGPASVDGSPCIYAEIRSLPASDPDPNADPRRRVLRTWRGVFRATPRLGG